MNSVKRTPAEVVCVGIAGIDILVRGLPADRFMKQEMFPAEDICISVGGDPLNEATILARLGKRVRFCSKVGQDLPGQLLLTECTKNGVDTSFVAVSEQSATSSTVVFISPDGERSFVSNMFNGNNVMQSFSLTDIDFSAFDGVKVVSFGSLFISPGFGDEALYTLFSQAKTRGALVCADMVAAGSPDGFDRLERAAGCIDYLFPNYDEGAYFSRETKADKIADYFLRRGVKNVVLKLGMDGCLVESETARTRVPAFPASVVDTTGAGDSFAGGFICGLAEDCSNADCARMGAAVASLVIGALGSNAGLRSRAQVDALLKSTL